METVRVEVIAYLNKGYTPTSTTWWWRGDRWPLGDDVDPGRVYKQLTTNPLWSLQQLLLYHLNDFMMVLRYKSMYCEKLVFLWHSFFEFVTLPSRHHVSAPKNSANYMWCQRSKVGQTATCGKSLSRGAEWGSEVACETFEFHWHQERRLCISGHACKNGNTRGVENKTEAAALKPLL